MRNSTEKRLPCGLWIAVFGPDGAGKSAVIDRLTGKLEASFAGVTQFHFRPMFRRRGMVRSAVTDPHGQAPRSTLASLCKLIVWLLDCWFGYLATIRPERSSSQLVIFDRYFLDILVDPRRYRLPACSMRFARMLVALAPRPDLCILLDVDAEVLQQRKPEVSPAESRRQRAAYREMFSALPNTLLVDAGYPVEEVAQQVAAAILAFQLCSSAQSSEASLIANL